MQRVFNITHPFAEQMKNAKYWECLNKEQEKSRRANIPELRKYRIISICFIKPLAILDKMKCTDKARKAVMIFPFEN